MMDWSSAMTRIREQEAAIDRLRAEVARLVAERDAVTRLCVHDLTHQESGYWSWVGQWGPVPFRCLLRSETRADAEEAVRRAAGLETEEAR